MISAIILAAGMSTRLNKRTKQLLPLGEKTVIEQVVDKLLTVNVDEIITVLGYRATEIEKLLKGRDITVIYNPDYELGQSTSLVQGLEGIEQNCTGILCMLGDQPLTRVSTINKLITEFKNREALIVFPQYKQQRGNPVIFSAELKEEMSQVEGDKGARQLLVKYQKYTKAIEVNDDGVITDIDTERDYQKVLQKFNNCRGSGG